MAESPATPTAGQRLLTPAATLSGNLFLIVGTIFFSLLALGLGWLPPRGRWIYLMARTWSRCLLWASGVRLKTESEPPLAADRRYVYMANHQSLFDIPVLISALPGQTRFLAKRSLFRIPLFGWVLKLGGFISIDRQDRSRAGESFAEAIRELHAGSSAVVFPEGTRSPDGSLLPFQRGGFLLALKSGLPIVPVGISGSRAVRPQGSYRIRPGRIVVRSGEPLDPTRFGVRDKARLVAEVRARVSELAGIRST